MIRGKKKMIRAMQRNKAGRELQARRGAGSGGWMYLEIGVAVLSRVIREVLTLIK